MLDDEKSLRVMEDKYGGKNGVPTYEEIFKTLAISSIANGLRITRESARSKGLKYFYTGSECLNGHKAERAVSNGNCIECLKSKDRDKKGKRNGWYG